MKYNLLFFLSYKYVHLYNQCGPDYYNNSESTYTLVYNIYTYSYIASCHRIKKYYYLISYKYAFTIHTFYNIILLIINNITQILPNTNL